jgi:HK97 family phage portal protein
VQVNRETALTCAAVWRAVALLARDVAKLPMLVYRRLDQGGKNRDPQHPAWALLKRKSNPDNTAYVFRQALMCHALIYGNGYAWIWRDGAGRPTAMWPLDPISTEPVVQQIGGLRYRTLLDGTWFNIPAEDMLHIRGIGSAGLGWSLIGKARELLGGYLAAAGYGAVFFKNNARPHVMIEHPAQMSEPAQKRFLTSWNAMYAGVNNAHKTAILEEGMKASILQITAKDAQMQEFMQFAVRQVANFFCVPPHKVGDVTTRTFSSLEQENQSYLDESLDPWLRTWEAECDAKLLAEAEQRSESHSCEFVREALVRANLAERYTAYNTALQGGWMSRDEIRARENLGPIPDGQGQKFFKPLNMGETDANAEPVGTT